MAPGYLRIGELSARVGVSAELLRAWERRYGLVQPQRTEGGFRLYSDDDVARVRAMLRHIDQGVAAAEAARLATASASSEAPAVRPSDLAPPQRAGIDEAAPWDAAERLRDRLERFDGSGAHRLLDDLFATFSIESVLRDVVLPCLADIGHRWQGGLASVGQEHFASNLLRARIVGLGRGWDQGSGPLTVLATPPGELHDVGLIAFGVALYRQGLRVLYLGASSPVDTIVSTARAVSPAAVVLSAVASEAFTAVAVELRDISRLAALHLAGAGASQQVAEAANATYLGADIVSAAQQLAGTAAVRNPASRG